MDTKKIIPGLLFTTALAWVSIKIQNLEVLQNMHLSSLIVAIVLGMLIKNILPVPETFSAGITFSVKRVLRLAIILLGFKLSFAEVTQIGGRGFILVFFVTIITILFTVWLGKKMGLDDKLALLIGAGSSICGASAIAAVAPVVDADERDTTFAIATVTIFGTIAMFAFPFMYKVFHLPNLLYAVWAGSSIHEVAQVVAAGFAAGDEAGQFATLIKLTRVLLIIPIAIFLGVKEAKKKQNGKTISMKQITIPWFVFGFLAVVIINSINIVPQNLTGQFLAIDAFLLTIAMGGMGLSTDLEKMKKVGMKPFYLGLTTSVFIAVLGFAASKLLFTGF
ncbi:conserved hypothetical integral membrane protein [Desulfonispora thiosulfatigenes DSM 11270]|uniref:Conserved hypothetical integral membrane protein n=1 Tax=Desulfonispora thiosulfatigenes DSM 11270 TaxID=656914 RepID=A0A1W1VEA9_DESTI|nr:YeiH family protein [Desulfonispora thiosulfatigenes]SMB91665.1 conserved hypothetical integral membrane protein [Desulfonispora thiosulfatigenes DSM 11270]